MSELQNPEPSRPGPIAGWAALVPLVVGGFGLVFGTSELSLQETGLRSGRTALIDFFRSQDRAVRARAATVKLLEGEVDALTAQAAPRIADVARLRAAAAKLPPIVGTQAVSGPALSVTLDDAKRTAEPARGFHRR